MTIRKKKPSGETEDVEVGIKQLLLSTPSWRVLLLVIIVSQHPVGRQLLGTFGFEFPDQRKLTVATEEARSAKTEITQIADAVKELTRDMASIKANNAIISSKVDRLEQTFTGFQIDFNKYRKPENPIQ